MGLLIIALVLYFGGKWLIEVTGANRPLTICRGCERLSRAPSCPYCCGHSEDRADCAVCRGESTVVQGEYESAHPVPADEEFFEHAQF
jgi:hypothetical protein